MFTYFNATLAPKLWNNQWELNSALYHWLTRRATFIIMIWWSDLYETRLETWNTQCWSTWHSFRYHLPKYQPRTGRLTWLIFASYSTRSDTMDRTRYICKGSVMFAFKALHHSEAPVFIKRCKGKEKRTTLGGDRTHYSHNGLKDIASIQDIILLSLAWYDTR